MKANVGAFDGWFRILLFIVALCTAILLGGNTWYFVIPGVLLFASAVFSWCAVYEMIGISTNKSENHT
jgi:hypothetical protein